MPTEEEARRAFREINKGLADLLLLAKEHEPWYARYLRWWNEITRRGK